MKERLLLTYLLTYLLTTLACLAACKVQPYGTAQKRAGRVIVVGGNLCMH